MGAKRLHVVPLNLVRCTAGTMFFWILLPFFGGIQAIAALTPSAWLWLMISVLTLLVVGDSLYFSSMDLAGVSWSMPVTNISPLWAVLLAVVLVGEPLSWSLVVGALMVIAGITLIGRSDSRPAGEESKKDRRARRTGLLMALAVSILWAIGNVALKPATEGTHAIVANSIRQPMAVVILLIPTLWRGQWRGFGTLAKRSWLLILLASLFGMGLATTFFVLAIQRAGAGRTAVLMASSPLMALPFSMLWLHERPTRWTFVGLLLATAGIFLVL